MFFIYFLYGAHPWYAWIFSFWVALLIFFTMLIMVCQNTTPKFSLHYISLKKINAFHFSSLHIIYISGFFTDNHCWKSWKLCMDSQELESAGRICTHSCSCSWAFRFYRAPASASVTFTCMLGWFDFFHLSVVSL
jgi:hypothetical protein